MRFLLLCFVCLIPQISHAAISFSEIAWMGTVNSANHEWIELYNDGEAVDVSGWSIVDGMNFSIELEGVVPAGAYVVLERTSDATVSGEAFFIYTGALVNSGATLQLKRVDGTLSDQVAGGEGWQNIGGDNLTKETAQYTDSGWVTFTDTPGRGVTSLEVENVAVEEVVETVRVTSSNGSGETVVLEVPDITLQLEINAQSVGYVSQNIYFSVDASGIGSHLVDSLQYEWNFGDGNTASKEEVDHVFKYPGTYVVAVYASYKRQEQVSRHEITILPVMISLTMNRAGDVQVNNDSPYEIDISRYRIKGDKVFTFPERSIMLPYQTITIPREKLGRTKVRLVGLYDSESLLVASSIPDAVKRAEVEVHQVAVLIPEPMISAMSFSRQFDEEVSESFNFASDIPSVELVEEDVLEIVQISTTSKTVEVTNDTDTQLASVASANPINSSRWTYLALIVMLGLAIIGINISSKRNEKV